MICFHRCNRLHRLMTRPDEKEWSKFCVSYSSDCAFYRPELNPWNRLLYQCVIACKIGLQTETQKLHFCLRPSSLLTILNFSERSRQTQRYFNVSTPSSRRDNYGLSAANYINMLKNIVTWERQRNQHV